MSATTEKPALHNNHDGTFTDVAEKAGVTLGNWSTGATFGDYDGDGLLDLFVPGYVHFDLEHLPDSGSAAASSVYCQFRARRSCAARAACLESLTTFFTTTATALHGCKREGGCRG